jgi:hypothetical protein
MDGTYLRSQKSQINQFANGANGLSRQASCRHGERIATDNRESCAGRRMFKLEALRHAVISSNLTRSSEAGPELES